MEAVIAVQVRAPEPRKEQVVKEFVVRVRETVEVEYTVEANDAHHAEVEAMPPPTLQNS